MSWADVFFLEEQKDALAATVGPFSLVLPHRTHDAFGDWLALLLIYGEGRGHRLII